MELRVSESLEEWGLQPLCSRIVATPGQVDRALGFSVLIPPAWLWNLLTQSILTQLAFDKIQTPEAQSMVDVGLCLRTPQWGFAAADGGRNGTEVECQCWGPLWALVFRTCSVNDTLPLSVWLLVCPACPSLCRLPGGSSQLCVIKEGESSLHPLIESCFAGAAHNYLASCSNLLIRQEAVSRRWG